MNRRLYSDVPDRDDRDGGHGVFHEYAYVLAWDMNLVATVPPRTHYR